MNIVYIHQYFNTPEKGGPLRSYYLAKQMVESGHAVQLITSHNKTTTHKTVIHGIEVTYLPCYYHQSFSFYKRIKSFFQFYFATLTHLNLISVPDLVYATSTPLTVGLIALRFKKKTKTPYIFEIRDLWPHVPIKLGYIKNIFIKKLLYKLEHKIYREAKSIICLSPNTLQYLKELGLEKKSSFVPNMSNCSYFNKSQKRPSIFTVSYIGSFGDANHLEYLFNIIDLVAINKLKITFNLVGEGTHFDYFKRKHHNNTYCTFHKSKNTAFVKSILDDSDATYTSFLNNEALEGNSPNKFFDSLASGKLTIVNTKGWLKDIVEQGQCGFYQNPENPQEFLDKIKPHLEDPKKLSTAQSNAREIAEQNYSTDILTKKVIDIISTLGDNAID